ncbi:hypothetical protein J1N35_038608 [Gossypium stocksii]|uniref:Cyclin-dependent protein kinase inhibitor SMR6 n=1 Tax=Gossypium stocksii TaxID=47602 RepID=A0A9D3ZMR8_9ROSI|nr:hypothetical protein J1N35_038608 [Gossypium stocksii]
MGFSEKPRIDGRLENEGKKWVITGRPSLKPINTKPSAEEEATAACSTTPTSKESKIADRLPCPPPPTKRKPPLRCHRNGVREFFNPPDLEALFNSHFHNAIRLPN